VDAPKIQAEGQLERAGGTRYQYGSHALFPTGDREIRFILRSETVQLRGCQRSTSWFDRHGKAVSKWLECMMFRLPKATVGCEDNACL